MTGKMFLVSALACGVCSHQINVALTLQRKRECQRSVVEPRLVVNFIKGVIKNTTNMSIILACHSNILWARWQINTVVWKYYLAAACSRECVPRALPARHNKVLINHPSLSLHNQTSKRRSHAKWYSMCIERYYTPISLAGEQVRLVTWRQL